MSKVWLFGLMALVLIGSVAAESCFTAVNVPQSNKMYWKAITYSEIVDAEFTDYLEREDVPSDLLTLGPGYQYQMRLEKDCFDGYLLSNLDVSGITSTQINLQQRDDDYYTTNFIENKIYTVSLEERDDVSTKLVSQVTTGVVEGTDYLALPVSFSEPNKHPELQAMLDAGLCNQNLKITAQLEDIRLAMWEKMTPTSTALTCSKQNIVDCAIADGNADSELYAATGMVLARSCGVPVRIAHGVSEGTFDGVDIYYNENKIHYWLEFYDDGWYNFEVVESGAGVPSGIEFNCIDGVDNDNNGDADCDDFMCFQDRACEATASTSSFDNAQSTDLDSLPNLVSVNNLTLGNEHGSVSWINQGLDLRNVNIDSGVVISANSINVNGVVPALNAPATATITATGDFQRLMKGVETCTECELLSSEVPIIFTIPGNGQYSAEFAEVVVVNETATVAEPPAAVTDEGVIKNTINKVKNAWNKLTNLGKGTVALLVLGILFLWWRRRQRKKNPFRR
jgi:hypothetical protein